MIINHEEHEGEKLFNLIFMSFMFFMVRIILYVYVRQVEDAGNRTACAVTLLFGCLRAEDQQIRQGAGGD
jgi:hypothetical protein